MDQAEAVLAAARLRGWKLGTAESCTGGLLAGSLTDRTGSSDVFDLGLVTYSNEAKTDLLGVPTDLLNTKGAVSAEVALAMADGLLARHARVDLAVSVTGIAGPGGGSAEKPVGLVYLAVAGRNQISSVSRFLFAGDRQAVRQATVLAALTELIQAMKLPT